MRPRVALALLAGLALSGAAHGEARPLRLATTTSTYETGLLDHILPPFESHHGVTVHAISVGTGKAMEIARAGDVDVILVHAREAEDRFVAEGYGVNRRDVMYNDFIILGPQSDPAGIRGLADIGQALTRVENAAHPFVSRGDDSGTHKKERHLWAGAGLTPRGDWYLEAGQGMSATLRMADEKDAYVLVDRATYLHHRGRLRLRPMVEGDTQLLNPYGVIAISPYRHPHVQYQLSMALVAWLTSPECQELIGQFRREGEQLFHPDAAGSRE
ncbi:substrate-binding domain-containing protein [Candidatus Latescibacterota bacterium]